MLKREGTTGPGDRNYIFIYFSTRGQKVQTCPVSKFMYYLCNLLFISCGSLFVTIQDLFSTISHLMSFAYLHPARREDIGTVKGGEVSSPSVY